MAPAPRTTRRRTSGSTRSSSDRSRTTCSSSATRARARRCSSTRPTSTSCCSRSARATGVRRVLTTHGHWDHIQAVTAVRDAGIDVGDRPGRRRDAPVLRLHHPRRRRHRGRRPAAPHDPHPGPHARVDVLPPRGPPGRCSAATPSSPAARATPRPRGRELPRRSSSRSTAGCSPCPPTCSSSRPRPRHHDRHRTPPPRRVGRPGLVALNPQRISR